MANQVVEGRQQTVTINSVTTNREACKIANTALRSIGAHRRTPNATNWEAYPAIESTSKRGAPRARRGLPKQGLEKQ
jgi:hypothetical protein